MVVSVVCTELKHTVEKADYLKFNNTLLKLKLKAALINAIAVV